MFGMWPEIMPLGDRGLLVRFGRTLSDDANRAAIAFARQLRARLPDGVREIDPNLVSVLLTYDPRVMAFERLAGEVRLLLSVAPGAASKAVPGAQRIAVTFGGEGGPDLEEAAAALKLSPAEFVAAHNSTPLRVLTTGFAPGFVYCGFHPEALRLPRRTTVRPPVPPGSILFAAGQTAITATAVRTGWHVIGRSAFRNFDPSADPPTKLLEGDSVTFVVET